jgi:lipopolysaccharide transport system ATP-binding protein
MSDVLVKVDNVSKRFCRSLKRSLWYGLQDLGSEIGGRRHGGGSGLPQSSADVELRPDEFWAVKDVSFELRRGECLGLIGRNGAGKTTLLRMLNGLIKPDTGRIEMHGQIGALIALGAGFNPLLSGRENIYISGSVLGYTNEEMDKLFDQIVDFAELASCIDSPVQTYSSGMQVRLGFSVASCLKSSIIILDEVLAVGDARFRSKCWKKIGEIISDSAVILVSHEAYALSRICDRGLYLSSGETKLDSPIAEALEAYVSDEFNSVNTARDELEYFHADPRIADVNIPRDHITVRQGKDFCIAIEIDSRENLDIDHAVINLNDRSDAAVAQVLTQFPDKQIKKGHFRYLICIRNILLPKGVYQTAIILSTKGGKVPALMIRHKIRLEVLGHPDYGPKYYPESVVTALEIPSLIA